MFVFWKGYGALVIFIGIFSFLLMNIIAAALFNNNNYVQAYLWPKLVALWVTAGACWFLGRYFNGKPEKAIDETTGEEIYVKPYHHLMFIKMEYWGVIFLIISFALVIKKLFG